MTSPRTRFYLDKQNKKWAGVCAGIADYTGIDVTLVRIGFVGSLFVIGPIAFAIYFIAAWMAPKKPIELYDQSRDEQKFWQGVRANPTRSAREVRSRFRELDRRLADVEAYVTSSNHRLAREIEELR
jgi:phage shock protein C